MHGALCIIKHIHAELSSGGTQKKRNERKLKIEWAGKSTRKNFVSKPLRMEEVLTFSESDDRPNVVEEYDSDELSTTSRFELLYGSAADSALTFASAAENEDAENPSEGGFVRFPEPEAMEISSVGEAKEEAPKKGRGGARAGAGRKSSTPRKEAKAKKGRKARSEYFTFTVNLFHELEPSLRDIAIFRRNLKKMVDSGDVGFYSVGHEIAPQTGMHHLQGYLETSSHDVRWTFDQFSTMIAKGMSRSDNDKQKIWVKESRGSATHNLVYTGKAVEEGRYYGRSEPNVQFRNYGRGHTCGKAMAQVRAGVPERIIAEENPDIWVRSYRALERYAELCATPRSWPTKLLWIHGPTGTGKSQRCMREYPPNDTNFWLDPPKNGNVWWDGLERHKTIVVDEVKPHTFGLGHVGFAYVLRLLDSTPLKVGKHGGKVNFAPELIVFTANFPPSEWFPEQYCDYKWDPDNPLYRRFRDFGTVELFGTDNEDYWRPRKAVISTSLHVQQVQHKNTLDLALEDYRRRVAAQKEEETRWRDKAAYFAERTLVRAHPPKEKEELDGPVTGNALDNPELHGWEDMFTLPSFLSDEHPQ